MASADQISCRNLGRQSWASALTPSGGEGRGTARRVVVPYGWLRRAAAIALGSGAQRSVCGAGAKKWAGIAAKIIPKVSSNAGQSLSHGFAVTAPFTQGSLWGRGNPSFSRWTGVRAAEVVDPYGKPNHPPKPAGAQRSVRARVGEGWAGIDARTIPKGGPPPRLPRQRLAKRKARKEQLVKSGLCPMTELCSTAHMVWKFE